MLTVFSPAVVGCPLNANLITNRFVKEIFFSTTGLTVRAHTQILQMTQIFNGVCRDQKAKDQIEGKKW